jgi:Cu(I)/Ag(I) efflux system membrane protein CusA/SilA
VSEQRPSRQPLPAEEGHTIPEQRNWLGRLLRAALENKLIVAVLVVGVILGGLITAPFDWDLGPLPRERVPVDAIPDIGDNQQIVFTEWPGHSPQDIDDQITLPLTTALLGLKDVQTIRSSSMYGFSSVYVIFDEGAEFYESRTRLQEKLFSLPAGLLPDGVQPRLGPDATALGQIYWYTLEGRDPNGNPTGGWDLEELRNVQDYYVKYALQAADGVAEVASVGGYQREFHVELDPDAMDVYDVTIDQIYRAIAESSLDVSARTIEINRVEYFVRGIGFLRDVEQLRDAVVRDAGAASVLVEHVAEVTLGPARRRGALDKGGAEAVGGVVVARYGANPMAVIDSVKQEVRRAQSAMPRKALVDLTRASRAEVGEYARANGFDAFRDGVIHQGAWLEHLSTTPQDRWPAWATISQLQIVPFYDRTELIDETLGTLENALTHQVLITLVVVILMVMHLRSSLLIGAMLPLAVLITFIAMKLVGVDANIVALSGIAIAIGTIVDMGIVLCENILRHLDRSDPERPRLEVIHRATSEVGGAVLTAVATTVISFLPVFTMSGQEGRLFRPLAFTKTFVLIASILIALFVLPTMAWLVFRRRSSSEIHTARGKRIGAWIVNIAIVLVVFTVLTILWLPLGPQRGLARNLLFTGGLIAVLIAFFRAFQWAYPAILGWCLRHKAAFLSIPVVLIIIGLAVWLGAATVLSPVERALEPVGLDDEFTETNLWVRGQQQFPGLGREFMPSLDEGSFLWMPTISVHGSITEALDTLSYQDRAIQSVPEVSQVVGKIGRVNSALDPAPVSMIETVIHYRPEYATLPDGTRVRQWRDHIRSPDDIWDEIVEAASYPGSTSAPKLQPIETRLVMLQTGMTAKLGVKVFGDDLAAMEQAAVAIEQELRRVPEIRSGTVNASRVVGKPYLLVDVQDPNSRRRRELHGVSAATVLRTLQTAIGGRVASMTIEGRRRYAIRLMYPRGLRDEWERIERIRVATRAGAQVPLTELAEVEYRRGPQMIRSEDTFKVTYVTFGGVDGAAEVDVVNAAREHLEAAIAEGRIVLPEGISYEFAGAYEAELRASRTLSFILPVACAAIFLILYLQFRSVAATGIIFIGIFVAFSGGFALLWLYAQPWAGDFEILGRRIREVFQMSPVNLSVAVWVGFLALLGIATDDGVVMGTYLEQSFRRREPEDVEGIRSAVVAAGTRRVRACLMTTATTILALLPVLTSTGRGSDIMVPMAIPSMGGMTIEVLTMLVVPVLYCLIREIRLKARRKLES